MNTQTLLDIALQKRNKEISATFLKQWNEKDFKTMERAICRHFANKTIQTRHGVYPPIYRTFEQLGEIFGLAYTSSSDFAGYWVCNTEIYSIYGNGFNYIGFALTSDNKPFAILWDKEENEILKPL